MSGIGLPAGGVHLKFSWLTGLKKDVVRQEVLGTIPTLFGKEKTQKDATPVVSLIRLTNELIKEGATYSLK